LYGPRTDPFMLTGDWLCCKLNIRTLPYVQDAMFLSKNLITADGLTLFLIDGGVAQVGADFHELT
jgi:hypothetical protein